MDKASRHPTKEGRHWTSEEDDRLREALAEQLKRLRAS